jgi:hypothetical protein
VLIREGCDEVQGFLLGYPGPSPVDMTPLEGARAPAGGRQGRISDAA